MWTIFKDPIELATILPFFFLIALCLGHETCGILAPRLEIEPWKAKLCWKAKSQPLDQQGSP